MLHVSTAHRRARLAVRHGLAPAHRYPGIAPATAAMVAWHATEPASVHLGLHARVGSLTVRDVEGALYQERSLVKQMAMRRTLWVVDRDLLPAVVAAAGRRVADAETRRLVRETATQAAHLGPDWLETALGEVVHAVTGQARSTRQLREALPHLGGTFVAAPGTKWSTQVPLMGRLTVILSAAGRVTRGVNAGHWRISRPVWTAMRSWLGEPLADMPAQAGYDALVRRLLWTFGPATETDLVWWLGATRTAVRSALRTLEAVQVGLDGPDPGWVLPGDTEDLTAPPGTEPWVALLPGLDPTTMGWKQRDWYLDPAHAPYLFDTAGNAGTTIWVDGRVVGCWVQDEAEHPRPILLQDVDRATRRRIETELDRLDAVLGGDHITNTFASPQMRGARLS